MKKILALLSALCLMTTAAGCGKKVGSSTLTSENVSQWEIVDAESSEELPPAPHNSGGFTYYTDSSLVPDESGERYLLDGSDDLTVTMSYEKMPVPCSVQCCNDYFYTARLQQYPQTTSEIIRLGSFDIFLMTADMSTEDRPDRMQKMYNAVKNNEVLSVTVDYPASREKKALKLAEDIITGAEYAGEYALPEEERTVENEVFSALIGPEWTMDEADSTEEQLVIRYSQGEDMAHYLALLTVAPADTDYYTADSAKAYAQQRYEELADSAFSSIFAAVDIVKEAEINGMSGYKVTYRMNNPVYGESIDEMYIFERGGRIMELDTKVFKYDGYEAVQGDMKLLLNCISVK